MTDKQSSKEQFKQILEEQRIDYQAARLRDTGQDYQEIPQGSHGAGIGPDAGE